MQKRMAGRFFVVPFEVFDALSELDLSAREIYYSLLRFHFIDEDWDTDTEWVKGHIRATKTDIISLAGVGRGHFYKNTWPALIDAGLVTDNDDGTITIERLKKKIDEGISPAKIREMEKEIKRLKAVTSNLPQTGGPQRKPDGSRTEVSSERTDLSSHGTDLSSQRTGVSFKGPRRKPLSPSSINTVSSFYTSIGQRKLSKKKRERGLKIYQKLIQEGFTPEEIQFAVDWTVKNSKEDLYDFSIIEHTIGQAMAAMEREEQKQKWREQKEQEAAEKERQEDEEQVQRRRILEYKESMGPEERKQLRKEAEEEIKKTGQYKDEFIDDFVIEIKENMILRKRLADESNIEN